MLNFSCSIYDFGIIHCTIEDYGSYKRFRVAAGGEGGPVIIDSQAKKHSLDLSLKQNKLYINTNNLIKEPLSLHKSSQISNTYTLEIDLNPFKFTYLVNNQPKIIVNDNQLLNYELYRTIEEQQNYVNIEQFVDATKYEEDINNLYFDTFGSANHSISQGPSSVALDFTFPTAKYLYGLPLHTTSFTLEETISEEPYRLFNSDVYGYPTGSRGAIYGTIPYILGRGEEDYVEMLWLNGADTWVDIKDTPHKTAHWISEAGIIEFFLFAAPTAELIVSKLNTIIGKAPMQLYAALGYHQSRYSYNDEEDVKKVDEGFDSRRIPYDSIWLDIDHTINRKYFTWDKSKFPDPLKLQELYKDKSRFVVTVVDPHLSDDKEYFVYSQALERGGSSVLVMNKDKEIYHGKCWPGSSVYVDFLNSNAREFWIDLVINYPEASDNLFIWNDMNEPSVFESIEMTMPKNNLYISLVTN